MEHFSSLLAQNKLLLLFSVIGLGYLVGQIKLFGLQFGVAAVLFVGIAFGAVDRRLVLPEEIYIIGLVLFVYTIGLQSGPSFFSSFNKKTLRANIFVVMMLVSAALLAALFTQLFGFDTPNAVGIFCGALTNTPALAASVEAIKSLTTEYPAELRETMINAPVITYGLTYPFGVLGLILWFHIFTKWNKIDFAQERAESETGAGSIRTQTFRIINPAVIGKKAEEVLGLIEGRRFVLSRIKRGETIDIILPETIFAKEDLVVAVGTPDSLKRAQIVLGEPTEEEVTLDQAGFEYRRIFVSNEHVVGKKIHDLHLEKEYGATITRLRRGDIDFVPPPETVLELGDRVRVVTRHENIRNITTLFGDSMRSISETDFLSVSLGIVIGVFLGMLPIPLPNGSSFKLGFAGGPLIVALFLGRLQRTGSITWTLPFNANLVLRQVGLVFFLAGIGTKAGHGFGETLQSEGIFVILAGVMLTTVISFLTLSIGYKYLHLPMSAVMGVMSAVSTQPAALAYANQQSQSDQPNIYYAMVYPASMIAKIILAQIIVTALW